MKTATLTNTDIQSLTGAFLAIAPLSTKVLQELFTRWTVTTPKRKALLTTTGDVERHLYFVTEGVQRCFCTSGDKDATIVFTYPFSFSGVIDSFLLQQPSKYDFETLTQSRLLCISHQDFMLIMQKHTELETWLRIAVLQTLSSVLERQKELILYTAAEKINTLLKRSPHLFNLLPHKYLASYLGLDPATFSKVLSQQVA